MAEVVLENVSRVFPNRVVAVDGVNLDVADREFIVLVGPSGCGKSTTLRMIAGLEEISSGQVRIGGRVVNDVAPKDRDIAMVFQNYALYPHMSVYKNMAFGLELRYGATWLTRAAARVLWPRKASELRARRHQIAERVHAAAAILGIERLLDRMPRQLSGGERQRVALGRAIVREPAAFLFDEPLSNLDAKMRVEMRRELKQLHRQLATTMIYVTHDQVEALTLGDRIVVMNHGSIQQIGTPMDVYRRPQNQFVAGFIGSPPMNFIRGVLGSDGGELRFRSGSLAVGVPLGERRLDLRPESEVVLGIRPENVRIHPAGASESVADAVVSLVEPLGDSTVVSLEVNSPDRANSLAIASKVDPGLEIGQGAKVGFSFVSGEMHLFDTSSGESLITNF